MTLCPNCGAASRKVYDAGTVDFWRCQDLTCMKLFQRPANTKSGSVNGVECVEASGEFETKE